MKQFLFAAAAALCLASQMQAGEKALFNGTDLTGWEGDPKLWSVQDGAITGKTTAEAPIKHNTFLIWKGGDVSDFELTLKYKFTPNAEKPFGNSGIQYRSKIVDAAEWVISGYQADCEVGKTYSGILYEEKGRGILAKRGQKVVISVGKDKDGKDKDIPKADGSVGNSDEIQAAINVDGWNEYKIVAKGNHIQHFINGKQTVDVTDEGALAAKSGVLALQLHQGPPMQIQFKDIVLKTE